MTTEHTGGGLIGKSVRRVEDPRLITGKGCYVDDMQLPGMLHLTFLRSPYPHATIRAIQTSAAQAMPGVVAIVTGDDLSAGLHVPVMPLVPGMQIPPHPLLARGAVHAVGVPVAAVVAHSRALAHDAAAAITVEYAALPAVVNAEQALEPGAPLAREELDSNICYRATKTGGDVAKAFAEADHIVRLHIASPRLVALALEPRGVLAKPEPTGDLTVWLSTQGPHRARADLATAIGVPEHRIRVIAPDVGGGFGSKGPLYREEALACHLALQLGRPIKWIATRREDFLTHESGPRPSHDLGAGAHPGRHDAGTQGPGGREPRRLPAHHQCHSAAVHDGDGPGLLSDPPLPRGGGGGLDQHRLDRAVSRRRPARGGAQHRALDR